MVVTICHDGYVRFWKIDLGNEKATNNFESGFKDSHGDKVVSEVVAKVSLQDIYYRNQSLRDMFLGEVDENIPADKI